MQTTLSPSGSGGFTRPWTDWMNLRRFACNRQPTRGCSGRSMNYRQVVLCKSFLINLLPEKMHLNVHFPDLKDIHGSYEYSSVSRTFTDQNNHSKATLQKPSFNKPCFKICRSALDMLSGAASL